jgi:hypothetical protein
MVCGLLRDGWEDHDSLGQIKAVVQLVRGAGRMELNRSSFSRSTFHAKCPRQLWRRSSNDLQRLPKHSSSAQFPQPAGCEEIFFHFVLLSPFSELPRTALLSPVASFVHDLFRFLL